MSTTTAVKMITLQSSDKEKFEVDEKVMTESLTIKHMIEDDCADSTIPLPNVTSKILAKVIEYCKKHVEKSSNEEDKEKKNPSSSSSDAAEDSLKKPVEESAENKEKNPSSSSSSKAAADSLKAWDAEFVKVDQSTLFDLILAANYLNIKSLLDLTCQAVADMIKGKTPEEIRKTFNLESDFTPEEEAEILRENQWAFESPTV